MCYTKFRVQEVGIVVWITPYGTLQVEVEVYGIVGWHVSAVASATSVLFPALYVLHPWH